MCGGTATLPVWKYSELETMQQFEGASLPFAVKAAVSDS
jgi:hypothetical protein